MPADTRVYRFGPFVLDARRRCLTRGDDPVSLPNRQLDVLLVLVAHAGHMVSKDLLSQTVWANLAVTDNSIVQAVKGLRQALGDQPDGRPYIESRKGKGYRFVAPVESAEAPPPAERPWLLPAVDADAALDAYRAFVDGRAALETLDRDAVGRAREAFALALRLEPNFAPAHIGMAHALVLGFESTRADTTPDRTSLCQAEHHARAACRLNPALGEAWSALAMVRHRGGDTREAIAAARKAIVLEPREWRHHLRLAEVSWGAERLLAADRALALSPGLALGYWFAATVFVARGAFDLALEYLRAGCEAQRAQPKGSRFSAVGLHWLLGLVIAAQSGRERLEAAREQLLRELALEAPGHIYARECTANTWHALGALSLREGRKEEAGSAFQEALARVPGHALAQVGLAASRGGRDITMAGGVEMGSSLGHASTVLEVSIVRSATLALRGQHDEAARLCEDALVTLHASRGSAGWLLPVEPLLHATANAEAWAQPLAILGDRAR